MTNFNRRRSQNAASLIRPSAVVKVCADCGHFAKRCYDFEGQPAGDYCQEHARVHGFCPLCGDALTETEKAAPNPICGAHNAVRRGWYHVDNDFDDDDAIPGDDEQ